MKPKFPNWDARFDTDTYIFGTAPADFLVAQQDRLKAAAGQNALAIADGEGRNSVFMAECGLNVTAMDSSEKGLEKARRLASDRKADIDFQLADLKTWDWAENQWDIVVAIFIQFADPQFRSEIFSGLKRTVKPGGLILLHGYTPKQVEYGTGGPPTPEVMYTEDLLRDAFGDMQIETLKAYEKVIDEGPGHSGLSALIDLVARKPG
ncbi:MAG: class I SAM-dependent methyltransferase [Paracoccaceae bacterium]|jgi:cyclopropane fatty-acyl-phospholipid synthase-like methyltransferase|nr:class I SAM-dependent methyltransferase [Paracoccaceae bacterium]MDP7185265.1 class I SAM-dependent methyltransferase [Paracoccaceae bacterium]